MNVVPGSTDVSLSMRAMVTDGTALEGKIHSDFTLWYRRDGAKVSVTPVTLAALTTPHADGGVKEIDDGWYRVDFPDATFAAGVDRVVIGGTVDGGVLLTIPVDLADVATFGEGAYTGTLTIDDGDSNPLEGAVVNARRGGVLKASGTTDVNGQITDWVLGAYTYEFSVRLDGYDPETDTLAVTGNAWTKAISLTASEPASVAGLCTVLFSILESGDPVVGAVCKAKLQGVNQAVDGSILSTAEMSDTTDANGAASLQLVQKGSIAKGTGIYEIWVEVGGRTIATVRTTIPNHLTYLFEDLLGD